MTDANATAELLLYVAHELQGVFHHIGKALTQYSQAGGLPPSLFNDADLDAAPTLKRKKDKKDRPKRKPSAFNNFVKEKIAELRSEGATQGTTQGNNGKPRMSTSFDASRPC